jgi:hypothetical protein
MKKIAVVALALAVGIPCFAAPIRVAIMDFEDQTGMRGDASLGGAVDPASLALKGVTLLAKDLMNADGFTLIDRRDFIAQMNQPVQTGTNAEPTTSYIHAAQALNADALIRGNLMSFSTGKQIVDQGGYKTEQTTVSIRLSLEAQDPVDGAVIAMTDGSARSTFRQTAASSTVLSEDDVLNLMEKALGDAIPKLRDALTAREAKLAARPKVKLDIKTDADPALIEIDGILVATTPVKALPVYQGDHVLKITRAGYRTITKRIMFEKDSEIEVPMLRTELTADEIKSVLDKANLDIIATDGIQPTLLINEIGEH